MDHLRGVLVGKGLSDGGTRAAGGRGPARSRWRGARWLVLTLVAGLVWAGLVGGAAPAGAVVPGTNGQIVFASRRDGNFEIYTMNADGTIQTRLTNNTAHDTDPAWSPNGNKIAFVSNRDGNNEIYVMNADGTGQMNLTRNTVDDISPAWSPDGTRIAFTSSGASSSEIFVMNANGTGRVQLTNNMASDLDPTWSPDGTRVSFYSFRDGSNDIYVMNAAVGSDQTRLTDHPEQDLEPAWSPDGTKIAFVSFRDGKNDIHVINADGTGLNNLTSLTAFASGRPAWSPDGTRIAFQSNRDADFEIYSMNADGTGVARLTNQEEQDDLPDWGVRPNVADVSAPYTSIASVVDGSGATVVNGGQTGSTSLTIAFAGTDDIAVAGFECKLDGADFAACTSPRALSGLALGAHAFEVRAKDVADKRDPTPASFAWTVVDRMPPETSILSAVDGNGTTVPNGGQTVSVAITIAFGGTDNVGVTGFECKLDGADFAACTSPRGLTGLAVGAHTLLVRATDAAGNTDTTSASFSWTVVTSAQATQNLIVAVGALPLPAGTKNSLISPLDTAAKRLADNNPGNDMAACDNYVEFKAKVAEQRAAGRLTVQQAADLTQAADAIKAAQRCP